MEEETTAKQKTASPFFIEFIYLLSGVIQGLLSLRFLFKIASANPSAPFVRFLYGVTEVFMQPFRNVFPIDTTQGAVFEWSVLVAMFVYSFLTWLIVKLLTIIFSSGPRY